MQLVSFPCLLVLSFLPFSLSFFLSFFFSLLSAPLCLLGQSEWCIFISQVSHENLCPQWQHPHQCIHAATPRTPPHTHSRTPTWLTFLVCISYQFWAVHVAAALIASCCCPRPAQQPHATNTAFATDTDTDTDSAHMPVTYATHSPFSLPPRTVCCA